MKRVPKFHYPRAFGSVALLACIAIWVFVHAFYFNTLILHDGWFHIFPIVYNIGKSSQCGALTQWLGAVDGGTPLVIYVISYSLTQLVRLPLILLWGCTHPGVLDAMWQYKLNVLLCYAMFAGGMYVLGRVLYDDRRSASYLFVATLFAGLCLDALHSNQVLSMLFWVPWILVAGVLFHRTRWRGESALFINALVVFFCAQLLDQYPHFIVLAALVAAIIYLSMTPDAFGAALRQWPRLWPSLIAIAATLWHLLVIREVIVDYLPSLRSDLIVDPSKFGETGFVQPTALLGTFWPAMFMSGFGELEKGMVVVLKTIFGRPAGSSFIFRLDALLFSIGLVPTTLMVAFLSDRSKPDSALRLGWLLFSLALFAISLQQTRLYLLIFHLPFFNVFRSYFLFFVFVVFAALVMSGYGFDRIVKMLPERRAEVLRRAVLLVAGAMFVSGMAIGFLAFISPQRAELGWVLRDAFLVDMAMIGCALIAMLLAIRSKCEVVIASAMMLGIALPQSIYVIKANAVVGTDVQSAVRAFGLEKEDLAPAAKTAPEHARNRRVCMFFAQCYLSQESTVSLKRDLQGTFLRHKDEPIFETVLSKAALQALVGVSQPPLWLSGGYAAISDRREIIRWLNDESDVIDALRRVTYVSGGIGKGLPPSGPQSAAAGRIGRVAQLGDTWDIEVQIDKPSLLNLAVNFDPHWRASVDGRPVTPLRANLGNVAIPLEKGRRIQVRYEFDKGRWVLWTRMGLVLLASLAALALTLFYVYQSRRDRFAS